jgi:hypothetical protein
MEDKFEYKFFSPSELFDLMNKSKKGDDLRTYLKGKKFDLIRYKNYKFENVTLGEFDFAKFDKEEETNDENKENNSVNKSQKHKLYFTEQKYKNKGFSKDLPDNDKFKISLSTESYTSFDKDNEDNEDKYKKNRKEAFKKVFEKGAAAAAAGGSKRKTNKKPMKKGTNKKNTSKRKTRSIFHL